MMTSPATHDDSDPKLKAAAAAHAHLAAANLRTHTASAASAGLLRAPNNAMNPGSAAQYVHSHGQTAMGNPRNAKRPRVA